MLEDDGEPVMCFCIHDADADGTMIYQSLVEETASRGRRRIEIVNLGLDPAEAVNMGLPSEKVDRSKGKSPAGYVSSEERDWLKRHRIELNAMTTPQFLSWLDRKMEQFEPKKLIPPSEVIQEKFEGELFSSVEGAVTEKILREARAKEQIQAAFEETKEKVAGESWGQEIREALDKNPALGWRAPVKVIAEEIVSGKEI
jgi:hypothetical protein